MEGFSKYFSFNELTDSSSKPHLVEQNRIDAMQFLFAGKRLSKLLESIRHILGNKPLSVQSGYRNKVLNKAIGSLAKASTHMKFEASDIVPNIPLKEAFNALLIAQRSGLLPELRKVIREDHKGILHVEVKMSPDEECHFYTTSDNEIFKKVG